MAAYSRKTFWTKSPDARGKGQGRRKNLDALSPKAHITPQLEFVQRVLANPDLRKTHKDIVESYSKLIVEGRTPEQAMQLVSNFLKKRNYPIK